MLRRYQQQLAHRCGLLEEREASLQRQQQDLEQQQRISVETLKQKQEQAVQDREEWQSQQKREHEQFKQQQVRLGQDVRAVEEQRERIDTMRAELEETHRETLELRLAVGESLANLEETSGTETAREQVAAARQSITDHYAQLREALVRHREEFEQARRQFQQRQEHFSKERQALADWVTEREGQLRIREEAVAGTELQSGQDEGGWRHVQARWTAEKQQAELIIRDLLRQLDAAGDEPS